VNSICSELCVLCVESFDFGPTYSGTRARQASRFGRLKTVSLLRPCKTAFFCHSTTLQQ
jgi:hypothetical protein